MGQNFLVLKAPLLLTTLWVGAAAYVAFVSTEGRKRLDDRNRLKAWSDEFKPALKSMGGLGFVSSIAGLYSYYATNNLNYVYGAVVMGLLFPFTMFMLRPHYNSLLKADEQDASSKRTNATIDSWVSAHRGRLIIGIIGGLIYLYAESTNVVQKL